MCNMILFSDCFTLDYIIVGVAAVLATAALYSLILVIVLLVIYSMKKRKSGKK